jgi:AraC-like DNA-binding protein
VKDQIIRIPTRTDIVVENGGLFSSRGRGAHPERVLESYELIFIKRGQLKLREEKRRFKLGPGDALILSPGRFHKGIGRFPDGLQFYWVHFRITVPPAELTGPDHLHIPQHAALKDPGHMAELFRQFLNDQQTGGERHAHRAAAYMLLMLSHMEQKEQADDEHGSTQRVASVEEFITTHFHKPITPAVIAAEFKLNLDYLGRIYKQAFGVTLSEGIRSKRLRQARDYLLNTDANVNEIALACGFGGSSYFRRVFKQVEGLSPSSWRKLHANYHTNTA